MRSSPDFTNILLWRYQFPSISVSKDQLTFLCVSDTFEKGNAHRWGWKREKNVKIAESRIIDGSFSDQPDHQHDDRHQISSENLPRPKESIYFDYFNCRRIRRYGVITRTLNVEFLQPQSDLFC